jgi:hypothetical protein
VPKRENFSLSFFALSEPIWVCDLGTGEKNRIFFKLTPDSFLKSPIQMGSLSINNSVTNISRLGTFKSFQTCSMVCSRYGTVW